MRIKRKKINDEIKELKEQKNIVKPEIENMKKIIDSLKADKRQISQQIRELNEEWDNQWYEYNEQQNLIKYIKDAHARIKGLKKREKKKQKEGEEKRKKKEKKDLKLPQLKNQKKKLNYSN